MKVSRFLKRGGPIFFIVCISAAIGLVIAHRKVTQYGLPLFPGKKMVSWVVEAKILFLANGESSTVKLALPEFFIERPDRNDESSSVGYGYNERYEEGRLTGVWTARKVKGNQAVYYRITIPDKTARKPVILGDIPPAEGAVLTFSSKAEGVAAKRLLDKCRAHSSDRESLVEQIRQHLTGETPSQEAGMLRRRYETEYHKGWMQVVMMDLLKAEGIPVREAYGVILNEDMGDQSPIFMLEYFDDTRSWKSIELKERKTPGRLVIWSRGQGLYELYGGDNSDLHFTVARSKAPLNAMKTLRNAPAWVGTIAALPVSERRAFRYLALIPVGAFVIVFLRNIIGLQMLGTFMPVLIALSLLEMRLGAALIMFSLILGLGLSFRSFLTKLNLLVVPRVAACVVVVTFLMMIVGIFSYKFGAMSGLRVTAFPMIVMAWTIERMSILWDEEGAKSALMQILGSLLAAILAYLIMRIRFIEYWAQYFPELLLILLGGIILIGRYTGYRLSELWRFRYFWLKQEPK